MAFKLIDATTAIALFDDGGAGPDRDYDDIVMKISVAPVPLPPAILLFGTALAGLGWLRRRAAGKGSVA